ncbi:Non-canonical poly(A) RNA polymerase papd5 [Nowakowskiella sp. JEL0407]|nr:Non-canonical poly(A) RNA polymerase papd5 [Nowakowskiella sp. JEL0407]
MNLLVLKSPFNLRQSIFFSTTNSLLKLPLIKRVTSKKKKPKKNPKEKPEPKVKLSLFASKKSSPWIPNDAISTGMDLSKEIRLLERHLTATEQEGAVRLSLLQRYQQLIRTKIPDSHLELYGSFCSGSGIPTSDVDLAVIIPNVLKVEQANRFVKEHVTQIGQLVKSIRPRPPTMVQILKNARVPVVKFRDRDTGYHVDISISFIPLSEDLCQKYFSELEQLRPLLLLLKLFLDNRDLNDASIGGIGSFALTMWLVAFLRLRKAFCTSTGVHKIEYKADADVGEIFMEFLCVFGSFQFKKFGILPGPPQSYDAQRERLTKVANSDVELLGELLGMDQQTMLAKDAHQQKHRPIRFIEINSMSLKTSARSEYGDTIFLRDELHEKAEFCLLTPFLEDNPLITKSTPKLKLIQAHFREAYEALLRANGEKDRVSLLGVILNTRKVDEFRRRLVLIKEISK